MISHNNEMYATIANDIQVEIKPLVFSIKNGYIVHSRDKYYWSKSTIKQYLDKYTIKGAIAYRPVKHTLSTIATLPVGIGETIKEILQEHGIFKYNSTIYFNSADKAWYLFTISGIITGVYYGASTFALPLNMILSYSEYQKISIIKDINFVGIEYFDNLFRYRLYLPEGEPEMLNTHNVVHYNHVKRNEEYRDTGETIKYGYHTFKELISTAGVKYYNKEISFYRLSLI